MDMPMKKRCTIAAQAEARGPLPELPRELLDALDKGPMTPGQVGDLMLAFNKAAIERAMDVEMNMHLGYRTGHPKPADQAHERNGASGKTLITDHDALRVDLPRDREGSFEPILIPRHARRFAGFDEKYEHYVPVHRDQMGGNGTHLMSQRFNTRVGRANGTFPHPTGTHKNIRAPVL